MSANDMHWDSELQRMRPGLEVDEYKRLVKEQIKMAEGLLLQHAHQPGVAADIRERIASLNVQLERIKRDSLR